MIIIKTKRLDSSDGENQSYYLSDLATIAGEMINFETSDRFFIDGAPKNIANDAIGRGRANGDSHFSDEKSHFSDGDSHQSKKYKIKPASGYLYIPDDMDMDLFEKDVKSAVLEMETKHPIGKNILKDKHSILVGYDTSVATKSELSVSMIDIDDDTTPYKQEKKNIKRKFTRQYSKNNTARFTWVVKKISDFDFTIRSDNLEDAVSRFLISVYYDANNTSKWEHNNIIFNVQPADI